MNRLLAFTLTLFVLTDGSLARADKTQPPTAVLTLEDAGRVHDIVLRITAGDETYRDAWMRSFDAIFAFADADKNGTIDEGEAKLVPSARAVRLAIGTGFAAPIDTVRSVRHDILQGADGACDREALRRYYLRHGIGCLPIGYGHLPHTEALTRSLVRALDGDGDGCLSEKEFREAEAIFERLDGNDDDLVGAGEFVEGMTYPGRAADRVLMPGSRVDLAASQDGSRVLCRLSEDDHRGSSSPVLQRPEEQRTQTEIDATPTTCRHSIGKGGLLHGDAWCVRGQLPEQVAALAAGFGGQESDEMMMTAEAGADARARGPERPWLTAAADRNGDGKVAADELNAWLALQRQIAAGHMLVSIYSGGGLFEVLDRNHDAALSVRELREAWRVLDAAGWTKDGRADPTSIPDQMLVVLSHGYPIKLAKDFEVSAKWFGHMDRNGDGDVSRREFTGPPTVFQKLDEDRDGLVSPTEALKLP